jgi:hypothetical protein
VILLVASITQANIWLTNGMDSSEIDVIGDVTGDNISDICNGYNCHINIQNNDVPKFQYYKHTKCGDQDVHIYRKQGNRFLANNYWYKLNYYERINDCTFSSRKDLGAANTSSYRYITYGNDINNDNILDCIIRDANIAKIMLGNNMFQSSLFPNDLIGPFIPREQNGYLISLLNKGNTYIADINNDTDNEIIINDNAPPGADIYEIITMTNWVYSGRGEYIQCIGDWDNDGYCDIVFANGRVQLGVPEPELSLLLLGITILKIKKRLSVETYKKFN